MLVYKSELKPTSWIGNSVPTVTVTVKTHLIQDLTAVSWKALKRIVPDLVVTNGTHDSSSSYPWSLPLQPNNHDVLWSQAPLEAQHQRTLWMHMCLLRNYLWLTWTYIGPRTSSLSWRGRHYIKCRTSLFQLQSGQRKFTLARVDEAAVWSKSTSWIFNFITY